MAFCFELADILHKFNEQRRDFKFKLRIGFDTGDLVSGILGSSLLNYDVWGDTVNFANKLCFGRKFILFCSFQVFFKLLLLL